MIEDKTVSKIENKIKDQKVANTLFKHLSAQEVIKLKEVSRVFYEQSTRHLTGKHGDTNIHLNRVIPPSNAIKRQQKIEFNAQSLRTLIRGLFNGEEKNSSQELDKFNQVMEKIRTAVQSNLGLSRVQREAHETSHPIYIKLGSPVFPDSELDQSRIIYQTKSSKEAGKDQSPQVAFLKDDSNEDGFSICFNSKFRKFLLHINGEGQVTSELTLKWDAIYEDLLPDNDKLQPLRAFTPWQRHSEANFFNGRSTDKVLGTLSKNYPGIFKYDLTSYFKEEPSFSIELDRNNPVGMPTAKKNIYLTLDDSFFIKPDNFGLNSNREPILAVVKTNSPLRGDCFSVVPVIYEQNKLHILVKGHQQQTEVVDVFHADFQTGQLQSWELGRSVKILGESLGQDKPALIGLNLLSTQPAEIMSHISAAPMVRGSGPGARQYWLNEFYPFTVYSEMVVIAEIFNTRLMSTPLATLEQTLNHSEATKGFYRLQFSRQELEKAKEFVFQLTIPNSFSKPEDFKFFYGENGNKLEETTQLAIHLLRRMVPQEFHHKIRIGINMCCPAASVENIGAGFGLRFRSDFIERIVKAIQKIDPQLKVEFKTLMLSSEDKFNQDNDPVPANKKRISEVQNQRFTEVVSNTNAHKLVYQGKSRNIEEYDADAVTRVVKRAKTSKDFQFGYSGMVSTIKDEALYDVGYDKIGEPHYSVESILEKVKSQLGTVPEEFEVMLGRVLLGSSWVLQGRYASDAEILLHTLLHAAIEREWAEGMGRYGVDIFQIQVLYNVRHVTNDEHRNYLINKVTNAESMQEMIDELFDQYLSIKKKGQCNILLLNKLEQAVFAAIPDNKSLLRYNSIAVPKKASDTGLGFFPSPDSNPPQEESSAGLVTVNKCNIV